MTSLRLCPAFSGPKDQVTSIGTSGLRFSDRSCRPRRHLSYGEEICSLGAVGNKSSQLLRGVPSPLGSRSHGTHFTTTRSVPRFPVKIAATVVSGIPRSASSSRTVNADLCGLHPARVPQLRGAACCRPSRTCSPRNSLGRLGGVGAARVFAQPSLRPPRNLTRHPNPFRKGTFRLHANRDADSLPRRLRHFQRHGHPGRVFTPGVQRPRWPDREVAVVHACAVQSTRLGGQVCPATVFLALPVAGFCPDRARIVFCLQVLSKSF